MKKVALIVALVLIGTVTLAGCGDTGATAVEEPAQDGVFTAEEPEFSERGHKAVVEVTLEDGQITAVAYDEVYEEGGGKKGDSEYNATMEGVSGISFDDAVAELEAALIESQNIDEVDVVSGATSSSEKFVSLVKEALNQ